MLPAVCAWLTSAATSAPGPVMGFQACLASQARYRPATMRQAERGLSRSRARCWAGAFDGACEVGTGGDAHLVEDVAQVGLDCLQAQEQLRRDLRVGLAVDDEPRHLEFASGQRLDACPAGLARPRAPVGTMAELSQLSLRALAVAPRTAHAESCRRALKFGHGMIPFAGFGERPARYRARQRGLDGGSGGVGRIG